MIVRTRFFEQASEVHTMSCDAGHPDVIRLTEQSKTAPNSTIQAKSGVVRNSIIAKISIDLKRPTRVHIYPRTNK